LKLVRALMVSEVEVSSVDARAVVRVMGAMRAEEEVQNRLFSRVALSKAGMDT
jgi:hypothetical protein